MVPGIDVLSTFAVEIVCLTFELDFQWIFDEKTKKKQRIFLELRVFFSNMGTLKSMHRRSVLSTFHDSHFFDFRKK